MTAEDEKVIILEGDYSNESVGYVPFGLSSTQAIISNNGQQYSIYHPTELNEDGSKKLISCGGVGDVKDKLEILEDSSVLVELKRNKLIVSDELSFLYFGRNLVGSYCTINFEGKFQTATGNGVGDVALSCKYENNRTTEIYSPTSNAIGFLIADNRLVVNIGKFVDTIEQFKEEVRGLVVDYELLNPIITHIPKELVPAILTHKTNIWEVGGAVKASSFKITQPVDAVGELRAEINEIKKQLGAVAALQLDQIN